MSLAITEIASSIPQVIAAIRLAKIVSASRDGVQQDIASVAGKRILAVSAVGNPAAFANQLRTSGGEVDTFSFPDHHRFSGHDVAEILRRSTQSEMVICTLKDAVKLRDLWPASGPALWYVSQSIDIESGSAAVDDLLARFQM